MLGLTAETQADGQPTPCYAAAVGAFSAICKLILIFLSLASLTMISLGSVGLLVLQ